VVAAVVRVTFNSDIGKPASTPPSRASLMPTSVGLMFPWAPGRRDFVDETSNA